MALVSVQVRATRPDTIRSLVPKPVKITQSLKICLIRKLSCDKLHFSTNTFLMYRKNKKKEKKENDLHNSKRHNKGQFGNVYRVHVASAYRSVKKNWRGQFHASSGASRLSISSKEPTRHQYQSPR
jgi:hypothetical protein